MDNNKSFRVKYDQDNSIDHLKINIKQSFDFLEVLSLKISQEDAYKLYTSNYGVIVGRVLANDGFGVPNAKISVFIQNTEVDETNEEDIIYPYITTATKNSNNIRYNLLPAEQTHACHQNVGTFPSKRTLLDNNVHVKVFDNYYKYTTVTNESGDYMIFGVPVGNQQIHVDVDLSDIGVLSQAPRDMEYKGYSLKQFDSPNKFKKSTNLDSLSQIISEDTTVFVYPFWGDREGGEIAISKKNINLQYKFEPTCVFMGSIFSDSNKSGISKTCKPSKAAGLMSEMVTSQGTIEMIRKTLDGKIEFHDINGNRLINNDGVWCYQIPMNLDYVITDEYGNIQPTNEPSKGIPTRAEVRFRITLDNNGDNFIQSKTGSYLIPNNPRTSDEEDYEFGQGCLPTSFVNLMWNKVYSVKNYIPRIQKDRLSLLAGRGTEVKNRKFTGIKSINYHEANNPIPYNNLYVSLTLKFMLLCLITKLIINAVRITNTVISDINHKLSIRIAPLICIDTRMLGDCDTILDITSKDYYVPCSISSGPKLIAKTKNEYPTGTTFAYEGVDSFYNSNYFVGRILSCIETSLASENEVVNFDFTNDWINGSLYAPRFFTKSKKNKKTGQVNLKYCGSSTSEFKNLNLIQTCAVGINNQGSLDDDTENICKDKGKCYKKTFNTPIKLGTLKSSNEEGIYYYKAIEFDTKNKYLHPTNIILLGSMTSCDQDGIPQLHQLLPTTTFKTPPDSVEIEDSGSFGEELIYDYKFLTEVISYVDTEELMELETEDRRTDCLYTTTVDDNKYTVNPITNQPIFSGQYYQYVVGYVGPYGEFKPVQDIFISGDTEDRTVLMTWTSGITRTNEVWIPATGNTGTPEISGIDWGNKADNPDNKIHYENGLFVGISCVDSDTYTKSCVNISRLCELGVDFDEQQEYGSGVLEIIKDVDGFITLDEISDGDARAMFATLNINNLSTISDNGRLKYNFNYTYPDGFDGRLISLTGDTISHDYMRFRFGDRYGYTSANYHKMYYSFTDPTDGADYSFPKYENSFYFYFGLKPGYTALDVFNTNYFVKCEGSKAPAFSLELSVNEKESICHGNDGSIKITLTDILLPCKIYVNNIKVLENVTENEIIYGYNSLSSKYYVVKVYDASENVVSDSIFLGKDDKLDFICSSINSTNYATPNGIIRVDSISNSINDYYYRISGTTIESAPVNITGYTTETSFNVTGMTGGSYVVTVQERNCPNNSKSVNISLTSPPALDCQFDVSSEIII